MNLTMLDNVFVALTVLGDCTCYIDDTRPDNHINCVIQWKQKPFILLYDDRDDITRYILRNSNVTAHIRFKKLLALAKSRHSYSIITDFFINWTTELRKDFIACTTDSLKLNFLRFFANGKPKFKTICGILDRKIGSGK